MKLRRKCFSPTWEKEILHVAICDSPREGLSESDKIQKSTARVGVTYEGGALVLLPTD